MPADSAAVAHLLALKTAAPFSALAPEDVSLLVERAVARSFDAGALVVPAGAPITAIHLVLEGRLAEDRGGRAWALREPYEIVGGVDALAESGQEVVVTAVEPARTLAIDRTQLLDVCHDRFGILATVASGVAAMAIAARRRLGADGGFARPDGRTGAPRVPDDADLVPLLARLRRVPALADLPVHTLAWAIGEATPVARAPGERLWTAGDVADHLLVVLDGVVEGASDDGRQRFALGADDVAGALDAVAGVPRWYGAAARGALRALRIPIGALLDVLEDDPGAAVRGLLRFAAATATLVGRAGVVAAV